MASGVAPPLTLRSKQMNQDLIKHTPYLWQRGGRYLHWCQGCKCGHTYNTRREGGPNWTFNQNLEKPSFTPSMRIFVPAGPYGDNDEQVPERTLCHYFVTDGQIAYCGDSDHPLKGQTLPLEPIPDNYGF
jgi:hypothetical protein